jgi:hypothetical protein
MDGKLVDGEGCFFHIEHISSHRMKKGYWILWEPQKKQKGTKDLFFWGWLLFEDRSLET